MHKQKIKEPNRMTEDPFHFVQIMLGHDIRHYLYIVKIIVIASILYYQMFNVVCIIEIIFKKKLDYVYQYLPAIILEQYHLWSNVILYVNHSKMLYVQETELFKYFWSPTIDTITTERETKKFKLTMVFLQIVFLTTCISFLPVVGDETQIIFCVMYIKSTFDTWAPVFSFLYYFTYLIISYGSSLYLIFILYLMFHVRLQFSLLNSYLMKLIEDSKEQRCSRNMQHVIYKRLIIFVKQQNNIKRAINNFHQMSKDVSILVLFMTAVVTMAAALYFILRHVSPPSNFRMGLVIATAVFNSVVMLGYGQELPDEAEKLYCTIINCPWVDWNEKNKKALWMILAYNKIPYEMNAFGIVGMNYTLLLKEFRMTYTIVVALYSTIRTN